MVLIQEAALKKWTLSGLNRGPAGYEPDALTTELRVRIIHPVGFEPTTNGLEGHCSSAELRVLKR